MSDDSSFSMTSTQSNSSKSIVHGHQGMYSTSRGCWSPANPANSAHGSTTQISAVSTMMGPPGLSNGQFLSHFCRHHMRFPCISRGAPVSCGPGVGALHGELDYASRDKAASDQISSTWRHVFRRQYASVADPSCLGHATWAGRSLGSHQKRPTTRDGSGRATSLDHRGGALGKGRRSPQWGG